MQLINTTGMAAGHTVCLDGSGRELLVVVIKGTFALPEPGRPARLREEQVPLVMADTFTGEPGLSAPVHESDFAARKHRCDVLLHGSAHAPGGRPASSVPVSLQVGPLTKAFNVVGDRTWQAGLSGIRPSAPQPFVRMPISYDIAFGGLDRESDDPAEHDAYRLNPAGRGYRKHLRNAWVEGRPLPNTEAVDAPVDWPAKPYAPMALGPVGRSWQQRACFAGTYDQAWLDHQFPFLPRDFDERFFQAAPTDQQLPLPSGPLAVTLRNLTPDGLCQFAVPHFSAKVRIVPHRGDREDVVAALDTLLFEPDLARFMMTWRVTRPLRRDVFEIARVVVGSDAALPGGLVKLDPGETAEPAAGNVHA